MTEQLGMKAVEASQVKDEERKKQANALARWCKNQRAAYKKEESTNCASAASHKNVLTDSRGWFLYGI